MEIDRESAFRSYIARFEERFGELAEGSFVKFGNQMVQRLSRADFEERMENYLRWHKYTQDALTSGGTISDVLIMEFEEASRWLAIEPPRILELFSGELGDPNERLTRTQSFAPPAESKS